MKQKRRTDTAWGTKWKKQAGVGVLTFLLAFLPGLMFPAIPVHAATGTVYSCTVNRCYAHPVTGLIEDSGGQASYATGQGMAEGAVSSVGMMEVTDGGAYYLTFRVSLVDYTSNHSFSVQNAGDSSWSEVTPTVTANGSDSNGTTSDLCIQAPSENCIVRCSMYVTPMGRDVVFYFYPNNYTEGNTTGMIASVVTDKKDGKAVTDENSQVNTAGSQVNTAGSQINADGSVQTDTAGSQVNTGGSGQVDAEDLAAESSDAALDNAQGLSLSTAEDVGESAKNQGSGMVTDTSTGITITGLIVAVTVSITISGLILMTAAAAIVCYFRKNWQRWGGYDEEEYDDANV